MTKRAKKEPILLLSSEIHPWEKQKGETSKAYAAFCVFRDLGPIRRSITTAVKKGNGAHRSFQLWYKIFLWKERAKEYDSYLDKESLSAQLEDVVKARKRYEGLGKALQRIGGHEIQVLLTRIDKDPNTSIGLTKSETMRFLREGTRLELIGLGEPVEPTGDGVEGATSYGELAKLAHAHEEEERQAEIAKGERENEERKNKRAEP